MKTFYIKTFGCKVNQYDSQVIREQFLNNGFKESESSVNPDICVVNTCAVTVRAQAKGRRYINYVKKRYPNTSLVVTGCIAGYQPESIRGNADFLADNNGKFSLIDNFVKKKVGIGNSEGISSFKGHTRAFIKVQDGCNQFCSYCILPYIRGRSRSRDAENIIKEVKRLSRNGYSEIVLTGIHLGDYGMDRGRNNGLAGLLEKLEGIDGLARIRLSSLEPQDVTSELIDKTACSKKICRHFHIPLQSGDDVILKRMNRRYTYNWYRDLIKKILSRVPDVSFSTDIIVGFPGETNAQFLNSCRAVEEIGFNKVHIFPYSLREGTAAASFPNRVSEKDIKARVKDIDKIASITALMLKKRLISSFQDVLIEKYAKNIQPDVLGWGYTAGYMPAVIKSADGNFKARAGSIVRLKITGIEGRYLTGAIRG